jgi:hypothetical protein
MLSLRRRIILCGALVRKFKYREKNCGIQKKKKKKKCSYPLICFVILLILCTHDVVPQWSRGS